jgi:hypothetical protein
MNEVITAIRRVIIDKKEPGEMISTSTSGEEAGAKPVPEAGLLFREATNTIGSAFNEEARPTLGMSFAKRFARC